MKRIVSLLAVMATMAAMVAASAMPAFAGSEKGNCFGVFASNANKAGQEVGVPAAGGAEVAEIAQRGRVGEGASTNCVGS